MDGEIPSTKQFLLDVWLELREIQGASWFLRGRVKDLATGEERGVGSMRDVGQFVDNAFASPGTPTRRWQDDP